MLRVVKPNGKIIIIEPNAQMIEKIQKKHPSHPPAEDPRKYLEDLDIEPELKELNKLNAYIMKKD